MSVSQKIPQSPALREAGYRLASHIADHKPRTVPASIVSVDGRIITARIEANSTIPLPLLTVPLMESEYIRAPLQPGCKGVLIGTDVNVDFLANLNTHRPNISDRKETLSSTIFIPISDKQWKPLDGRALHLYGVDAVEVTNRLEGPTTLSLTEESVTLTQGEKTRITLSGETITLSTGGATLTLSEGNIAINGNLTINGKAYKDHTHSNGNQGAPTGGVI